MDQTHTRALEALQPFIHLANSASATSPRFIANLITNATSSPQTYIFAELLETPAIQALRSPDTPKEFQGYLTLLEIFAWGTWQEYQSTPNLPQLNAEQTLKLRLLSLLTLSSTIKPLTYDALMSALSISTPADLESLVTKAIYSSLITARLSPATSPPTVIVTSVAPLRDVKPESLSSMISVLMEWETRCGDVINDIEAEIAKIKTNSAKRRTDERGRAALIEKTLADWNKDGGLGGVLGGRKFALQSKDGGAGLKFAAAGSSSGGGGGGSGGSGNKREFNADDHEDDGYWDNTGSEGTFDPGAVVGSRMDIDEGAGSSSSSRTGTGAASSSTTAATAAAGARHKRVLGKKS